MVIDTTNIIADTASIIEDWAEICIIAQLNTIYNDTGFASLSKFTTIPYILFDDFADNKFENRGFLSYPEWLVGTETWSAVNGYLEKTATQDAWGNIYVADTNFDNMVWECSITLTDVGWDDGVIIALGSEPDIISDFLGDGYYLWITGAVNITFYRIKASTSEVSIVIESPWTADLNKHKFKIARQSGGLWEIFMDGTSLGTATDNIFTSTSYFSINNWGINEQIDDIGIYNYSNIWPNNKVTLDFQPLSSRERYIVKEMGLNASNVYSVYCPTSINVREDYYIFRYTEFGDTGTAGVGTSNTLTDSSKSWIPDEYIGFYLIDSAGTIFEITDNDATTVTVDGTPISGTYYIAEVYAIKNIERYEDHKLLIVEKYLKDN